MGPVSFLKKGISSSKGQISFAEYLVAIVLFLTFAVYFVIQLVNFFPVYLNQLKDEEIRSEAYQISELLVDDTGFPINWQNIVQSNPSAVQRIGLNDETLNLTSVVSTPKIYALYVQCQGDGYNKVKNWLGTSHDFSISINLINSESGSAIPPTLFCGSPSPIERSINASIMRFADINDTFYARFIVQVV